MTLQYLQPLTGSELEAACEDKANAKFAKYLRKHFVFADRRYYPKRPDKNAPRKEWRAYYAELAEVNDAKKELHDNKANMVYTLYRDVTYVVSVDNGHYFILSGNIHKTPVSVKDVSTNKTPMKFVGRRVAGDNDAIFVPFMGGMYTVNIVTGQFKEVKHA